MLEVTSLSKTYAGGEVALDDVSFSVEKGEVLAVIGHSGAGKSTLLRCINRLVEYTGDIRLDGVSIKEANKQELRRIRCNIAMIFQNYNLVESSSVIENVLDGKLGQMNFFRALFGVYTDSEKKRALSIIKDVGLEDWAYKPCHALSGGQKQRVGIARSIMQEASLMLADEPTSSLDVASSEVVLGLIKDLSRKCGMSIILNLHQIDLAKRFADRIIGLKQGKLVFEGAPSSLDDEALKTIFSK